MQLELIRGCRLHRLSQAAPPEREREREISSPYHNMHRLHRLTNLIGVQWPRAAPPPMVLESLPTELLVRILMYLELETLSRCDQLSRLFHGIDSPVEKALRELANIGGFGVPKTLPSNQANWTQALLFSAMLRRDSHRNLVASLELHSAFVDADGTCLICGDDSDPEQPIDSYTRYYPRLLGPSVHELVELVRSIPKPIRGLEGVRVQSIAAGYAHNLVLATDGTTFSWGMGWDGQLGHGDQAHVEIPKRIMGLINVRGLAAAYGHSLAFTSDGTLWSWGEDIQNGALGHGDDEPEFELRPRRLDALAEKCICAVAADSAGNGSSYAVDTDGGSFAWGGALCLDNEPTLPVRIPALCGERVSTIAAYEWRGCATTWEGDLWQWGKWVGVELLPTPLKGTPLDGHRVVSVAISSFICLALTDDGTVFSWACDAARQNNCKYRRIHLLEPLGHGDGPDASDELLHTPRPLKALLSHRICSIAAGGRSAIAAGCANTTAASATDGEAAAALCPKPWAYWTWGSTDEGYKPLLGHGTSRDNTNVPRRVMAIGA